MSDDQQPQMLNFFGKEYPMDNLSEELKAKVRLTSQLESNILFHKVELEALQIAYDLKLGEIRRELETITPNP